MSTVVCHYSGSLFPPFMPWSLIILVFAMDFQASGCTSTLHSFGSTRFLLTSSSVLFLAPSGVALFYEASVSTSVTQACGVTLDRLAFDVALGRHPADLTGGSASSGFGSVGQPSGFIKETCQGSISAPLTFFSTLVFPSASSSSSLSFISSTYTSKTPSLHSGTVVHGTRMRLVGGGVMSGSL